MRKLIAGAVLAGAALQALSAEEIEQYRAGAGMGYAKAAELNRYPGPPHALERCEAIVRQPAKQARARARLTVKEPGKAE